MIIITADNRKAGTGDAERAALHKTMAAASGKVRVEGKDFIISVTYRGTNPGTVPNRGATFGSKAIDSSLKQHQAPDPVFPGKTSFGRLVFERDK